MFQTHMKRPNSMRLKPNVKIILLQVRCLGYYLIEVSCAAKRLGYVAFEPTFVFQNEHKYQYF